MTGAPRPRVYVASVSGYGPGALRDAVERGLTHVRPRLRGNVFAKANWVFAHRGLAPAATTRPELVHAALGALFEQDPRLYVLLGGNSGLGVSTRRMARAARGRSPLFSRRGFWALPRLHGGRVGLAPTDETRYYRYQLSVGRPMTGEELLDPGVDVPPEGRYWDRVVTGWELYHADSVLLFPKLKTNVLSHGISAAVKLQGIGLLRDVDRLDGHNWHNDRRIVDMLEVADPDLVITDAVDIGMGGNQMTQCGHPLGAVIVADNAVAHDAVCCHILGRDPAEVPHLLLAAERGFGPLELDAIDLQTERPLEELRLRVEGFGHSGFRKADEFSEHFEQVTGHSFPLDVQCGAPYDVPGSGGILLDWLYTAWDDPGFRERMKGWPPCEVRVGHLEKPPEQARVYLVGDRAIESFRSAATGLRTLVRLPPRIRRVLRFPAALQSFRLADGRRGIAVEIPGDPPSHRDLILGFWIGSLGKLRASFLRLDLVIESYLFGFLTALRRWRRNRGGITVVHARKIARLEQRRWRLKWGRSERLQLREPLPPLPARSLPPSGDERRA